ncbi:MAG: cobalamin B12-binding domain-containing protein, partial [Candidatus Diapherotrites archaeon]
MLLEYAQNTKHITLKPDLNRPKLKSTTYKKLEQGLMPNSLKTTEKKEEVKVLLIVPYYTRIKRPLTAIWNSIKKNQKNKEHLKKAKKTIRTIEEIGVTHIEEMKRAGTPMGLLRIGTAAKLKGYKVKILDAVSEGWDNEKYYFTTTEGSTINSYGLTKKEIEKRIKEYAPQVVGISCDYTHQWGNAREIADLVKTINEKIVVIMGGTHAHGLPQDVLLDSPTDYVVYGQADVTFPELLDFLTEKKESKKKIEEIKGIIFRKNNKIIKNEKRFFMNNIDTIAVHDLSLINLDFYSKEYHSAGKRKRKNGKLLYGFASIGCNTGCTFCTIPCVQGKWVPVGEETFD